MRAQGAGVHRVVEAGCYGVIACGSLASESVCTLIFGDIADMLRQRRTSGPVCREGRCVGLTRREHECRRRRKQSRRYESCPVGVYARSETLPTSELRLLHDYVALKIIQEADQIVECVVLSLPDEIICSPRLLRASNDMRHLRISRRASSA